MLRPALAALVLASAGLSAIGADGASAEPPVTYLAEAVLSRCDLVVRARIVERKTFATGVTVATVEVIDVISGTEKRRRLPVTTGDPRTIAGSFPDGVLFLRRHTRGAPYELIQQFRLLDDVGRARLAALRQYVAAQALPTADARVARMREIHLENVSSGDAWTRGNAIRELSWFTRHWPGVFTAEDRRLLLEVREGVGETTLRELLEGCLHRIDAALVERGDGADPSPAVAGDGKEDSEEYAQALDRARTEGVPVAERREALERLARRWPGRAGVDVEPFLDDPARELRQRAGCLLGELGHAPSAARLIETLRREGEDPDVRRETIRALGNLGAAAATEALAAAIAEPALRRAALYALAQIGTDRAREVLAAARARFGSLDSEAAERLRKYFDFLDSEAFRKQERALAEIRARRRERGW